MQSFKILCRVPDEATAFLDLWANRGAFPADAELKDMQRIWGGFLFTFATESTEILSDGLRPIKLEDFLATVAKAAPPELVPEAHTPNAPPAKPKAPKQEQKAKAVKIEPAKEGGD